VFVGHLTAVCKVRLHLWVENWSFSVSCRRKIRKYVMFVFSSLTIWHWTYLVEACSKTMGKWNLLGGCYFYVRWLLFLGCISGGLKLIIAAA